MGQIAQNKKFTFLPISQLFVDILKKCQQILIIETRTDIVTFLGTKILLILCILILYDTNLSIINIHNPYNNYRYLRNLHLCWPSIAGLVMSMVCIGTPNKSMVQIFNIDVCLLCKPVPPKNIFVF